MPTSPLRLLQIVHTTGYGGLERQVLSLSLGLREAGHSVTLALRPGSWLSRQAAREGLSWEPVRFRGLVDPLSYLDLWRIVRRRRIDIVHGHSRRSAFYSALSARLGGCGSVATIHSLQTWKGFRRNQRMIAVSGAVRDFLVRKGLPEARIDRVYNGVGQIAPPDARQRAAARAALGLEEGDIAVAMVGRVVPHKGHDLLVRALACLPESLRNVRLFMVGDADSQWGRGVADLARLLGVESRVHFPGYRDDVQPVLHAMDVFVQPSRSEALSLSLLEAMAAGLPVVAARTGGMPEVVGHERDGLLFESGDAGDLAHQLARLADPDLRGRLGQGAVARQRSLFTTDAMVAATENVYRRLRQERRHA